MGAEQRREWEHVFHPPPRSAGDQLRTYIQTFGCRANQYDSEAMRSLVIAAGGQIADRPDDADIAIFNSCAVTAEAEADLRQSIRRAAKKNPAIRNIVTGCAAALSDGLRARPLRELPRVEAIIGGADLPAVANALGITLPTAPGTGKQSGARALLRIQDGCDAHCTFCATTLARGANRSRRISEVVEEAAALARHHAEIVLTGIHIGTYGEDIGSSLGELVRTLLSEVPGVRFRLSSVEATEVDDGLLKGFVAGGVAPYLHAPLQSGSDRVLRRMGRNWYTASTYERRVREIVGDRPVFGLGADVIAGFPGETEEEHVDTMRLVERLPFTSLHVFPYSPRPGTPAERIGNPVAPATVRRRARELRDLGALKGAAYARSREGGAADVVVIEGRQGLTEDYLTVSVLAPGHMRGTRFAATLGRGDAGLVAADLPGNAGEGE